MNDKAAKIGSLADLAKLAGLSTSTVSRALAGSPLIRLETRERIAALAREHGYRPNVVGRNLRTGRTQAIAVILPLGHEVGQPVSDPFFITLLGFLADALSQRGYDLLLSRVIPSDGDWLARMTDSGRVDGVLVIGQSNQIDTIEAVAARYQPLVVWGAAFPGRLQCTVGTDNRAGGELATRHLLDAGRRHLAFFGNPNFPELGERYEGFLAAHRQLGISPPAHVLPVHLTPQTAYETIGEFLDDGAAIDGVVAATDIIAMSAIRALTERGVSVPEDVAVVGYDDLEIAIHASPALTTIRQNLHAGAEAMVDLLMRRLSGEVSASMVLQPELIVRDSAR